MRGEKTRNQCAEDSFSVYRPGLAVRRHGAATIRDFPVFRAALDRCAELLRSHLDKPLLSVLYPRGRRAVSPLDETAYTQPALFALEYALAELWKSWGIQPSAVLGHSVGEYAAACVAGVFSLKTG